MRHRVKIINEPDVTFTQCQTNCSSKQAEPILPPIEFSITATPQYYDSPYPLCVHELPSRLQQDPHMLRLVDAFPPDTSSPHTPHFGNKYHSEEAQRCKQIMHWQQLRNFDALYVPCPRLHHKQ